MATRTTADDAIGLVIVFAWFGILIAGGIGWIMNIAKIVAATAEPITALFIIRCVGVIAVPVGGVLGWF